MATYAKISDLDAATTLDGTELVEVVQSATSKKATISQINAVSAIETATADATIGDSDGNIWEVTPTSANVTITLPTLADNPGRLIEVHMLGSATGYTVITGEGAETIEGASQLTLISQYDRVGLRGGSATWTLSQLVASYDTGWVANTGWFGYTATVTHNLGVEIDDLVCVVYISETGAATDAIFAADAASSGATEYGLQIRRASANTLTLQSGANGVMYYDTNGAPVVWGSASAGHYRVLVYRHK